MCFNKEANKEKSQIELTFPQLFPYLKYIRTSINKKINRDI